MDDFTHLVDLAGERIGGVVMAANDEFFASKDSLLEHGPPVFIDGQYTDRGKWMDGWETRRRRAPGYDWCIVRLGLPGEIRGLVVDTTHFKGNHPESCAVEACEADQLADVATLTAPDHPWTDLLPRTILRGDSVNSFPVARSMRATHLRLNIHPDGGVARLRVYGLVRPDWAAIARRAGHVDLSGIENGGRVIACSDMFFGSRDNLIQPGRSIGMRDGWETRRRRGPGHDWVVIRLGSRGRIHRLEVDTTHFKGNAPGRCSVDACDAPDGATDASPLEGLWREVLPEIALQPHTRHTFESEVKQAAVARYVRLNIFPDGGVSRCRVWGVMDSSE